MSKGDCADASAYITGLVEFDRRWQEYERQRIKRTAEEGLAQLERGEYFEYETIEQLRDDVFSRLGQKPEGESLTP